MTAQNTIAWLESKNSAASDVDNGLSLSSEIRSQLKRPISIDDTGLTDKFLADLLIKHLYELGVSTQITLVKSLALSGPIIETLLAQLKEKACVEVLASATDGSGMRYGLTERGRFLALEALQKNGYLGAAPVSLAHYQNLTLAQSVHHQRVGRDEMHRAFSDTVVDPQLLDELGPAVHSGRPIFVYGNPGTGKTFITQRLSRLLGEPVFIPSAIAIGEEVLQLFDPIFHIPLHTHQQPDEISLTEGYDPRFTLCQRPFVLSGGELTMDGLEVNVDRAAKLQQAPLQLKASNGIYLIDDLGRQRMDPVDLFNRWIVPLESKEDHLTLASGRRFSVPFDVILLFSTNLNPLELADEAFLRRLGHKIHFQPLREKEYRQIWQQLAEENAVQTESGFFEYLLKELHERNNVPMLPCHPRDLLGMVLDHACYTGEARVLNQETISTAWRNYFVTVN